MDLAWLLAPPLPPAIPRQRLLYQRLRAAIVDARLAPGTRLPASRRLATDLGIARNTVLHAYEQLIAEGCLVADRHGTRVAALPIHAPGGRTTAGRAAPAAAPMASARAEPTAPGARPARRSPGLSARADAALAAEPVAATVLPLAPGAQDFAAFPFRAWRACLDRAWRAATPRQLGYAPPGGEPALRRAVAAYLSSTRGIPVTPDQVVVTAGTQSGLDLCARLLADAGDIAWVENPGYVAARSAFALAGLALHPVAVDAEGMAPSAEDWRRHRPRLVMLTPSHQYPTGQVLSLARRLQLIDTARETGAWLIEDDYDSELRASGPGLPALYGLRGDAPVVYAGTFSKTLYPGLRLGYLVVPPEIAKDFARAAGQAARPGQGIEQNALADFIERGDYTAHLRRMRRRYRERQAALRAALARHLGEDLVLSGGSAGLHLCLWLPYEVADVGVAAEAASRGLQVRPLSRHALPPARCNGLLLGYGAFDEAVIERSVVLLRQTLANDPGWIALNRRGARPAPPGA